VIRPIFEGDMPRKKRTPKSGAASGTIAGVLLKEDPLSTGMLDVVFRKIRSCVCFTKREFIIYLKSAEFSTAST
jgi:hypothetical protein